MEEENNGKSFSKIMKKSHLDMPFPDLEDNIMNQIETQEEMRKEQSQYMRWSWISFVAGTVFAIILTILLPGVELQVQGISINSLILLIEMVIAISIVLNLEDLLLFSRHKFYNINKLESLK